MEGSEIVKRDHQRNKSEIVKLVKEMFSLKNGAMKNTRKNCKN